MVENMDSHMRQFLADRKLNIADLSKKTEKKSAEELQALRKLAI